MVKIKKTNLTVQNESLKKYIKELENYLHYSELQNIALNTMIDLAENKVFRLKIYWSTLTVLLSPSEWQHHIGKYHIKRIFNHLNAVAQYRCISIVNASSNSIDN